MFFLDDAVHSARYHSLAQHVTPQHTTNLYGACHCVYTTLQLLPAVP